MIAVTCELNLDADQRQILDAADAMLATHYPLSRLREGGVDRLDAIAEFGGFTLALGDPDDGFSVVEEALLHARLGRHAVTPDSLAAALAARLLPDAPAVGCAIPSGDRLLLTAGREVRHAVVFGATDIALIETDGQGKPVQSLGHGGPLRRVDRSEVRIVAQDAELRDLADLLISAQLLGIAEAARDAAVAYALTREQFGRPIGSFQAIKHLCADMAIAAEGLSALLDMAAISLRDGREDAAFQIAALRVLAPRIALSNTRACVQIHGGIGFSAEAEAHHFVKRAHLLRQMLGQGSILDHSAPLSPLRPRQGD